MIKARLFSYRDSGIYYKRFGISPDRHYDKLRESYGADAAIEMIDRNMMKAWEAKWNEDRKREEERQRILESECPF